MSFREVKAEELTMNPFTKIGKEWLLITAGNEEKCNTMTASWGAMGVMWGKNAVTVFKRFFHRIAFSVAYSNAVEQAVYCLFLEKFFVFVKLSKFFGFFFQFLSVIEFQSKSGSQFFSYFMSAASALSCYCNNHIPCLLCNDVAFIYCQNTFSELLYSKKIEMYMPKSTINCLHKS